MREPLCPDWPELEKECLELFWEDFLYLSNLRCVTKLGRRRIYQHTDDYSKICGNCYLHLPPATNLKYAHLHEHHLVHVNAVRNNTQCAICRTAIVMVKKAEECQGCLREFDHAYRPSLNAGNGIPVVSSLNQIRELCENNIS